MWWSSANRANSRLRLGSCARLPRRSFGLTHQRSRAEIEVGPFDVRLSDSTDLSVVNLTDDFTQLGLTRGTIRVSVYRLASRDSMEVDTPNGAIIGQALVNMMRSDGIVRVPARYDLLAVLGMALGLFLSAFASTEFQAVQFMPAVILPQLLLCGLLVPRDLMAPLLDWISYALPMTYAYDALARATSGETGPELALDAAVLVGSIVVALALGAATLRRRTP